MACGGIANAALTESGRVFTWGSSDDGGLGRPGGPDAPEQFPGEVRVCVCACVGGRAVSVFLLDCCLRRLIGLSCRFSCFSGTRAIVVRTGRGVGGTVSRV